MHQLGPPISAIECKTMQLSPKQCNFAQEKCMIRCNRVSVRTQGTVQPFAIRRLHCTCYIVYVALCLLYNVCCIAPVTLCLLHCVCCIMSVALRFCIVSVSLLCLLHCVCCIASRSKRSQVIGSTGLGGANSALGLLLPMSSSSAILHSN